MNTSKQDDKLDTWNPLAQKLGKSEQHDKQLRGAIYKIFRDLGVASADSGMEKPYVIEGADDILALFTTAQLQLLTELGPFNFVQPCEPECSPERHSYHQGQWDMAGQMTKWLEHKKQELEGKI